MVMLATAPKDEAGAAEPSIWVLLCHCGRRSCRSVLESYHANQPWEAVCATDVRRRMPLERRPGRRRCPGRRDVHGTGGGMADGCACSVDEILGDEYGHVRVGPVGKPFSGVDYYAISCRRATGLLQSMYTRNKIITTREGLRIGMCCASPVGRISRHPHWTLNLPIAQIIMSDGRA
jgi:hypothetical protein